MSETEDRKYTTRKIVSIMNYLRISSEPIKNKFCNESFPPNKDDESLDESLSSEGEKQISSNDDASHFQKIKVNDRVISKKLRDETPAPTPIAGSVGLRLDLTGETTESMPLVGT